MTARRVLWVPPMHVSVERASRGWKVRVEPEDGPPRVYRYGSRAQARYFAAVFALQPDALPTENLIRERRRAAPADDGMALAADALF